jgi:hypothetical protein
VGAQQLAATVERAGDDCGIEVAPADQSQNYDLARLLNWRIARFRASKSETRSYSMSIQDEAGLILNLYELRREETMRKARDWYFREFNPESMSDFMAAIAGEHSGHLRMVVSYWDMAAAMVNRGAISLELFTDTNGEHIGVFAKIEPLVAEIRAAVGPGFAVNLEKLIDAMPDGRKRVAGSREQMKAFRAQMTQRTAQTSA